MKIKQTWILLLYCLLMQLTAPAQLPQYHVRLLTEQQGLSTAEILDISKDKEGFLWLLSLSAVQRYDGRQSKQFLFPETIRKIFIDGKNRKWVLGRTGIYLFKNEYDGFEEIELKTKTAFSTVSLFNIDGKLYLLMVNQVLQYNELEKKFVSYDQYRFSFPKLTADISGHWGNALFATTADTIYKFDLRNKTKQGLAFESISYLLATGNDELIVSDWNSRSYRISFVDNSIKEILPGQVKHAKKNDFIRFFGAAEIMPGSFFLSSNMGIVQFNKSNNEFFMPVIYNRGSPLNNNTSIKTIFKGNDGSIFMGHADGLAFFNPRSPGMNYIRDYSCEQGSIPDIDVRCFTEDDAGNTWLGTINGIARLNMQSGEVKNYLPSKTGSNNYPTIRDLLFVDGYIIAGTGSKGIMILNTKTNVFTRPLFTTDSIGRKTSELLNEDFIWRILRLQNGDIFITGAKHCYLLNSKTLLARLAPTQIVPGVSRSAAQDANGRIWHGTSIGLTCYSDNYERLFSIKDSFADKRLASFCEWKKDHMLIGGKGFYEVVTNGRLISSFKKISVLPTGRFIFCMQKDVLGDIWLGTDEGLYRYRPTTNTIELFDAADNVQPQAFNSNGLYLARNNWIFAGGKTGFNYFDPAAVKKKASILNPQLSSFSVGNNDSMFFKKNPPYEVNYFNRSIVINISTPEYLRPFTLRYRYKLKEKDTAWIDNGNSNTIRMHNLPYGDYHFVAAASYDGNNWFTTKQAITFSVLKPWWHQWWFRILCLAIIAAIITAIFLYRKRQARNKAHQQAIDYFANSGHEHSSTDDILWDITRNCISRLGFEDCVIYLVDGDREVLKQRAAYGAKSPKRNEIINPIEIPVGKGITGYVALTGKAELVNDTSKDERYIVDDDARQSEIAIPIIHNEHIIGVIDSEHRKKNFFTQQHLETLQTIASICASKISVAMAVEKMQHAIREVDEVNTKMLETKFMNLRLQMNPHFLFNSLSSIQHLIVSKQTNEAYKYLSIFSNFLRSILQYADKTLITVDDELKMLEMYVKLESIGFDDSFSYDIQVDEELETEDIFIPPLLLQPLVENAIWHGLLHKQGPKYFSVSLSNRHDEQLICVVEDNGVGRAQATAIKEKNLHTSGYTSKATDLIKERLVLLQQKTGKAASITVEDKEAGSGTRVTIIIPFYNNEAL